MSFSEWKYGLLDEVVEIIMGQSPTGDTCNKVGNGTPLLNGPTEFGDFYPTPTQYTTNPKKISQIGDLLFCVRGSTTGRMNWSNQEFAIGRGLAAIRHKQGYDYKHFAKGIIEVNLSTLLSEATGSTFPNVSGQQLKNLQVFIPNLKTQQRIASILSSLDDAIELNQQINKTLEEMAKAIFKEWFVDFNYPNATGKFQETEVGKIPVGWKVGKLGDVCVVNKNTLNKRVDVLEWIDYIEISEVSKGLIGKVTRYNLGEEPSRAKRKIKHGDTVLSTVRPDRGSYFLAINPKKTDIASTGFAVFSPLKVPFSYLHLFLTDEVSFKYYGQVANGGAYPAINPNTIMEMDLVIPDSEILSAFHNVVELLFIQIQQNIEENQSLSNLRDTVLPKLMKGEIEIK